MSKDTQENVGMSYLDSNATKLFKIYLPLLIFLFVLLFPFYWMGITAFKPEPQTALMVSAGVSLATPAFIMA